MLYNVVIRSLMAYGAAVVHRTMDPGGKAWGLAATLAPIQNKCLRVVGGMYKATAIRHMHTETFTPELDLYLNKRVAATEDRWEKTGMAEIVRESASKVAALLLEKGLCP